MYVVDAVVEMVDDDLLHGAVVLFAQLENKVVGKGAFQFYMIDFQYDRLRFIETNENGHKTVPILLLEHEIEGIPLDFGAMQVGNFQFHFFHCEKI